MYTISKTFRFEASHQLVHHDGKCARLHGHSWVFGVELYGKDLRTVGPQQNMLIDYGDISLVVKPIIEKFLDHHHLNDTLGTDMPTSEVVARWIWEMLEPSFGEMLKAITVDETCTSSCRYAKDGG